MRDGRRALWVAMVAAVAWMVASAPALSPAFNAPIRGWLVESAGGSPLDPLVRFVAVWANIALILASRGRATDADLWSVAAAELLVAGLPVWMLCAWTRRFARVTPWHRDPMLMATVVWTALLGACFAPPLLGAMTDERVSTAVASHPDGAVACAAQDGLRPRDE